MFEELGYNVPAKILKPTADKKKQWFWFWILMKK